MNIGAESAHRTAEPALQSGRRKWLLGLTLVTVALGVFVGLAAGVLTGGELIFDLAIMETIHRLTSPWLTVIMRVITDSGSALAIIVLSIGLAVYLQRRARRRSESILLLITQAGSAALGEALKSIFARPRPHLFPWLTAAGGWSFPSGHTLNAVVLGGMLAWLVGRRLSGWRRIVLWIGVTLWAGLVGLSRVYLGVHYPSDVLASLAVGSICLLGVAYVFRDAVPQPAA